MAGLRDPTRSAGLRRQGRGLVNGRLYELQRNLRVTLQDHDLIGLRAREDLPEGFAPFAESNSGKLARGEMAVSRIIDGALASPPEWLSGLIERAVWRGIEQAAQELRVAVDGLDGRDVADFHALAAVSEVTAIAGETRRRMMRHVARALEIKATPEVLMREARETLHKVTRFRLVLLVNTGVVKAVNGGKLYAYAANGIRQVGIEPEWVPFLHTHDSNVLHDRATRKQKVRKRKAENAARRALRHITRQRERERRARAIAPELVNVLTAGDDRVCEDCQDIAEEGPYDIDKAVDLNSGSSQLQMCVRAVVRQAVRGDCRTGGMGVRARAAA